VALKQLGRLSGRRVYGSEDFAQREIFLRIEHTAQYTQGKNGNTLQVSGRRRVLFYRLGIYIYPEILIFAVSELEGDGVLAEVGSGLQCLLHVVVNGRIDP